MHFILPKLLKATVVARFEIFPSSVAHAYVKISLQSGNLALSILELGLQVFNLTILSAKEEAQSS